MMIALHQQARTTPLIRAEMAASDDPVSTLMQRYGVTAATVRKWRQRTAFHDRSHTAQRLQTTLNPAQEAIVVYLRTALLLPLDDLLAVTREFLCPQASRSGVDRCLRRHGVSNLQALLPATAAAPHKTLQDLCAGLRTHRCKVPATDGRRAHTALPVRRDRAGNPLGIRRLKGGQKRPFSHGVSQGAAAGVSHQDHPPPDRQRQRCAALGIEHRLTGIRKPQTNGMVERFFGTHQRYPEDPPLPITPGSRTNTAPLRQPVQSSFAATRPQCKATHPCNETMACPAP